MATLSGEKQVHGMKTGQFTGFEVTLNADGVAVIRFNFPESMNAFTQASKRDLIETILQAQADHRVRVVVFTGTGRAFMAGDDLNPERQAQTRPTLVPGLPFFAPAAPIETYVALRTCSQLLNVTVLQLDKLTIAAINGYAIQSGLSLALACDFRIAAPNAQLGSATLRYGFLPDEGGHYLLVRLLGVARAMDILMRKRILSAEEALQLGLLNKIVPAEDLLQDALAFAAELASGPQVAMRLLKRALHNAASMSLEGALDDIATKTAITDTHADAIEGWSAFREKRTPRFNQWLEGGSARASSGEGEST